MIGTHDSLTYLRPRLRIMSLFRFLWRTQEKSVAEQIEAGVGFFDIRVRRQGDKWRVCHGLVDLDMTFASLRHVATIFGTSGRKCRIVLEKGDSKKFLEEAEDLLDFDGMAEIVIKKGWRILKQEGPGYRDYSYVPWFSGVGFKQNLRWLLRNLSTIRGWARRHNPEITEAMIEDPNVVHFMDYV